MLTVLESIKLSAEYLAKKGIESPRINAELLLAHILNCKRLDLYLTFDRPLSDEEIKLYRSFLERRGKCEPLQYIVGSVEFYGLQFKVNSSVLIPRPETEILVETIIENYRAKGRVKILDIGTGSGNIAVSLAHNLTDAIITGTDISEEALELARENSLLNNTGEQINFLHNDILINDIGQKDFDIVVSNPPYVPASEFNGLRPELRVYEPRQALTDNSDGLNYYRVITARAGSLLRPGGRLYFEMGKGQEEEVKKIFKEYNFTSIIIKNDYLNIERVISGVIL